MLSVKKTALAHAGVWLLWIAFHIIGDVVTELRLDKESAVYTFLIISLVTIPFTYFTYFFSFRYYEKHKNLLLLILSILFLSVLFLFSENVIQTVVFPELNIYPENRGAPMNRAYIVYSLNRYYQHSFPFAMLYWYSFTLTRSALRQQQLEVEKVKSDNDKLLSDYNFLKMQINPHFIFNCLQSVDNYILKNDTEKASHYLNRFSTLMRRTLQYGPETEIKLKDEIANMELYLQLEQMRQSHTFRYEIDTRQVQDADFIRVPSMIIQPYVENAVKHAMGVDGKGDLITLIFAETAETLQCVIEDNGPGILQSREKKKALPALHTSLGTAITKQRIETYNSLNRGRITERTEDLSLAGDGRTGTRVTLMFYFK